MEAKPGEIEPTLESDSDATIELDEASWGKAAAFAASEAEAAETRNLRLRRRVSSPRRCLYLDAKTLLLPH